MSKADSLKPISNYLCTLLPTHGMASTKARIVVTDMMDRLVTGGYGWDRVMQYHAKVSILHTTNKYSILMDMMQGEEKFVRKLIPYIFMSKDDLPETLTPEKVLSKIYEFVEEWKSKLFNIISSDMRAITQVRAGF